MVRNTTTWTFRNGESIDIPTDNGAYILSSGCGSGKTTMFKEIIREHWNEGIIYAVDSRKECRSIYSFIMTELVDRSVINGEKLKASDVFMLYTKDSDDVFSNQIEENMVNYRKDPKILLGKKIVIITHPRLFSDLPDYLLIYNPKITDDLPVFDGDFEKLMKRDDLRKHILIDETPQFFKPLIKIPGWFPLAISNDNDGEFVASKRIGEIYDRFIRNTSYDPFKGDSKLSRLKREASLKIISKNLSLWLKNPKDEYDIQFLPRDFFCDGMKTRILIAEGCGDLLFGSQKNYTLIDLPNKYRSKIEIRSFNFNLKRSMIPSDIEKKTFLMSLKNIIDNEPKGTLIVTWKDFKGSESSDMTSEANESKWRDEVREELIRMGVPENRFAVTYYGACDTKSTNDYREFGSVICSGKWFLPQSSCQ